MHHKIQTPSSVYQFTVYPANMQFNRLSGIYIFLIIPDVTPSIEGSHSELPENQQPSTFYTLLYIGITNNFRGRFNSHHKIAVAHEQGMTHIGILKITSGRKRKKIEREILKYLNPPLNQTWLHNYS